MKIQVLLNYLLIYLWFDFCTFDYLDLREQDIADTYCPRGV